MDAFRLVIRTPEETVYEGEATLLSGASELGELQIYPGHAAMTATVDFARVTVENKDHVATYFIKQGFLHTDPEANRTEILGLSCQKTEEADVQSLSEYRTFILGKLAARENLNEFQVRYLEESQAAVEKQIETILSKS